MGDLRVPDLGLEKIRGHAESLDEIDDLQADPAALTAHVLQGGRIPLRYTHLHYVPARVSGEELSPALLPKECFTNRKLSLDKLSQLLSLPGLCLFQILG